MGSFVRRPTLHVAYLRRSREKPSHASSSRFWPRTESEAPWIFPIRDGISRLSLPSPPPSLLFLLLEEAIYRRDPTGKRVGVQRRRISRVETSSSPLCRDDRGPRDLDKRSRRARQGRVTVHRMKVTRIIHGPVFLWPRSSRWSQNV